MGLNFHYLNSLDDSTVGLADRPIFGQEVVLQDHLLEICYNPHEKSKYVLILKNEKRLHMLHSE